MSERLTDAQLARLETDADVARGYYARHGTLPTSTGLDALDRIQAVVAELRDRRARDLTDEDREALRTVRDHWGPPERESLPEIMEERRRVFAVLDKLIGGGS